MVVEEPSGYASAAVTLLRDEVESARGALPKTAEIEGRSWAQLYTDPFVN